MKLIILFFLCQITFGQNFLDSGTISISNGQVIAFKSLRLIDTKVSFINKADNTELTYLLATIKWIKDDKGTEIFKNPNLEDTINTSSTENSQIADSINTRNEISSPNLVFISCTNIQENGIKMTTDQLKEKFSFDSSILEQYKTGKGLRTAGNIAFFGGLGILIIQGSLNVSGESASGEKSFNIMWLGLGGVVLSVPLLVSGKSKIKEALNAYNSRNKTTYQVQLNLNNSGLGICMSF